MKIELLLRRIRQGSKNNVRFTDFIKLVEAYGFVFAGQVGSHKGYRHPCGAVLTLQEKDGEAKPYQISQFLKSVDAFNLQIR